MALVCPECSGSLAITLSIELGSTNTFDETALQTASCGSCSFVGVALYEESRRGGLDSESVTHRVFSIDPSYIESIQHLAAGCKTLKQGSCTCAAHEKFRILYEEIKKKQGKDIVWQSQDKDVLDSLYDELDDFMFLV